MRILRSAANYVLFTIPMSVVVGFFYIGWYAILFALPVAIIAGVAVRLRMRHWDPW